MNVNLDALIPREDFSFTDVNNSQKFSADRISITDFKKESFLKCIYVNLIFKERQIFGVL